jgi:hypothetical protein
MVARAADGEVCAIGYCAGDFSLDEPGVGGIVARRLSQLANHSVETALSVDMNIGPEFLLDPFSIDIAASRAQKEFQYSEGLALQNQPLRAATNFACRQAGAEFTETNVALFLVGFHAELPLLSYELVVSARNSIHNFIGWTGSTRYRHSLGG